jgi:Gram-negative bacterial TonB protein C-terminal
VVVYPQTLISSPERRRDIVATIEVVVNERGTVDTVRLVNDPRNVGEYLLVTTSLSAVKSWRFRPASKDGHAVRYRTLVPLVAR